MDSISDLVTVVFFLFERSGSEMGLVFVLNELKTLELRELSSIVVLSSAV